MVFSAPTSALTVAESPLDFSPVAEGIGLTSTIADPGILAGAEQLVLELHLHAVDYPPGEDLLVEVALSCGEGQEEIFSTMDLFTAEGGDSDRHCKFDLSGFLGSDLSGCAEQGLRIEVRSLGDLLTLALNEEAPYARIQIIKPD